MTVLRCTFGDEAAAGAVTDALAGPGRPAGIERVESAPLSLLISVDPARTSLALLVALIDAELRGRPRRIEPAGELDDETLCAFASSLLGEPDLDTSRLIETYVEPMLDMR